MSSSKEAVPGFPLIEVQGDPHERGFQYGLKCKKSIQEMAKEGYNLVMRSSPSVSSEKDYLRLLNKFLPFAEDYAPDLVEEMRGVAEGAEARFEDIFALNCLGELSYNAETFGCTCFVALQEATRDGGIYGGKNNDWWGRFSRHGVVLKVRPSHGPQVIMVLPAGFIGMEGRNSRGINTEGNGILSLDSRYGVPVILMIRKILQQERIGDALYTAMNCRRAAGINLIIFDDNGEAFDLEMTAQHHELFYVEEGIFAHSNHVLSPRMSPYSDFSWIPDTFIRVNRMKRLLRQRYGEIKLKDAMNVFRDHVNYPYSICRHLDPAVPDEERQWQFETSGSQVIDTRNSTYWVCSRNPCENEYVSYKAF